MSGVSYIRRPNRPLMIYALLFLVVGGAIVALQVARKGDGLLHFDPHGHPDPTEHGR